MANNTAFPVIDTRALQALEGPIEAATGERPSILLVALESGLYLAGRNITSRSAGMILGTAVRQLAESFRRDHGDKAAKEVIEQAARWVREEGRCVDLATELSTQGPVKLGH